MKLTCCPLLAILLILPSFSLQANDVALRNWRAWRGLHAYDLDGQPLWQRDFGRRTTRNRFGEDRSPALHGDSPVVVWDHEGEHFSEVLDKRTGITRWSRSREESTNWSTALVLAAQQTDAPASPSTVAAPARSTRIDPRVAARSIDIPAAEALIASQPHLVILDVRTEQEFAAGHLRGARNLNSRSPDFTNLLAQLDRSQPYLVHSAGGGSRVTKTLEILDQLGLTNWVNLAGGFSAWTNASKAIVK